MPFQVMLMPTTASPDHAEVLAVVRSAIMADGGAVGSDGQTVRTRDGAEFQLAGRGGHDFVINELSPSLCRIVFEAARRTNSTVQRGGSDVTPLKMKGSTGKPLYGEGEPTDQITNPHSLCLRLARDLRDWNRFVRDTQAEGLMDANEETLEPPPGPGAEALVSSDSSGVAAHCEEMLKRLNWTIVRKALTHNPQWGVVWRGDIVTKDYPDTPSRVLCYKIPHAHGHADIMFSDRPLQMFDPKQSTAPLDAALVQPSH